MLQIKNRSSIDAVFCNQRICCDLFLFHRPPQRAVINQTGTSSHDICLIIVGKEILEYTEKCKYNIGIKWQSRRDLHASRKILLFRREQA